MITVILKLLLIMMMCTTAGFIYLRTATWGKKGSICYSRLEEMLKMYLNLAKRIYRLVKNSFYVCDGQRAGEPESHLSDDGLPGLVIFVEEVVSLNEELAGVLLRLSHPLLPQQDGLIGDFVSVKLL